MKLKLGILALLLISMTLNSCKRQEEIVIPDNTAPPDGTIEEVVYDSYVNRSYISLLGRKPVDAEFTAGKNLLQAGGLSQQSREDFLGTVMANPEYTYHMFDVYRSQLLESNDTTDIRNQINIFDIILSDTAFILFWDVATTEKARLVKVLEIPSLLLSGSINEIEMHKRLIDNYFYDQINMGTQNFVISLFRHFLLRFPTDSELARSEDMVNGFNSNIFFQVGETKTEFIDIFFGSEDYFEGQVRDLYLKYVYREPGTQEMESLTLEYMNNVDFDAIMKAVLSLDEYVGI